MSLLDLMQTGNSGGEQLHGVANAIVTNNQDPEHMGRVKLRFPWRKGEDESHWARVATLMAGNGRGTYFLPEVGDEVLVAFEMGNIDHPYVIGAIWNGQDNPPNKNGDGDNNIRTIKSRSGHELTFDDTNGQEKVTLQTKGGHQIVLDNTSGSEKIEIVDHTGSNKIKMDSVQKEIHIESAMRLNLKSQMIEISADTTLTIKAGATLTLQGAMVNIN
ncbi:phage baseplate assembly protein V [Paenibacillus spongiae]|uniref:Phage baseplate assembly protein V n=1 Tax=Paenibacillus spongiae TaxID=2909671 RepID=A0ABY5S3H3_9BACL|nr:phage baseplate assembly protein V [Paenibacillus spongiae]UVI27385.1 phage baseplate assembly protein V [Paenibacillus spongiae]